MKDYEAFFEARENNAVYAFLGLTAPPGSKVGVHISYSKPQPVFYTLFFSAHSRMVFVFCGCPSQSTCWSDTQSPETNFQASTSQQHTAVMCWFIWRMLCSLEASASPSFYPKNSVFGTDSLSVSSLQSHSALFEVIGKTFFASERRAGSSPSLVIIVSYHWIFFFFLLYTLGTNERVVNSCTEECTRNLDENNCHKTKELFQFSEKT